MLATISSYQRLRNSHIIWANQRRPIMSSAARGDITAHSPATSATNMRIAYFTNQYPAVSHTFIRREILAIEALGDEVIRYAVRPGERIVDDQDKVELTKTRYISRASVVEWVRCLVAAVVDDPVKMLRVLRQAMHIGWRSDRGVLRNLAYAWEATILAHWCRRDAIEHLHVHFGTNPAAIAMFAHQLSGVPYSFTAHGSEEFEKAPLLALDQKLLHAKFAICVSSFGRAQLMRWSAPDQWQKIEVVHCGVDAGFIRTAVTPPAPEARLVCVGRLDEHKAQIVLVAAARRLHAAGVRFQIVLVGDGTMRSDVENAIRNGHLEQQISITGWVSGERVKSEILAARALILPSFSENMPVVIMEAMALGRPVISTYVAGIPELVRPGITGWLVPASDSDALADAIEECLTAPPDRLAAMGAAARAWIEDRHDVAKEASKLKALFAANGSQVSGAEFLPSAARRQ